MPTAKPVEIVRCPVCSWSARVMVWSPENKRNAELRRDKHLVQKHNERLALD